MVQTWIGLVWASSRPLYWPLVAKPLFRASSRPKIPLRPGIEPGATACQSMSLPLHQTSLVHKGPPTHTNTDNRASDLLTMQTQSETNLLQLSKACNSSGNVKKTFGKRFLAETHRAPPSSKHYCEPAWIKKACEQANCQKCTQSAWGSQWGTHASFQRRPRTAILRILLDTQNLEQSKILQNLCIQ